MIERPTPETDDALQGVWYRGDHGSAIPSLCRKLERERDELRETLERERALLLDPAQVHQGMLRGTIAKLDWPTLEHIHGEHPAQAELWKAVVENDHNWQAQDYAEQMRVLAGSLARTLVALPHCECFNVEPDKCQRCSVIAKSREAGIL